MLIKPNKLKRGDTIGVVAPSGTMSVVSDAVIKNAEEFFGKYGINVVYGENVNKEWYGSGGSIQDRVSDLMNMFLNKDIHAIIPIFGGYSANQLLPYLNYDIIKENKKILIGYSDITALALALYKKSDLVTFIGPSFADLGQPFPLVYTHTYFESVLIEGDNNIEIEPSYQCMDEKWFFDLEKQPVIQKHEGWNIEKHGNATGKIIGGNLSTIALLLSTEYIPSFKDSILFIEECDEFNYQMVDRMFTQLEQTGILNDVKGIVVGRFQKDSSFPDYKPYKELISRITKDLDIPVITDVDFGHTYPMITLPIGVNCMIDTYKKKITLLESSVQ